MGTNGPWNWRWTLHKTFKMMLVRPVMTKLKMTLGGDCALSACTPTPTSVYRSSHSMLVIGWGGVSLWTEVCHLPPTSCCIWNKANFPFHQSGLFIGFWVMNSQGCPPHSFQQHYLMVPPTQSITTPTLSWELWLSTTTQIKPGTPEMSVFPVYCSSLYILAYIYLFSLIFMSKHQ